MNVIDYEKVKVYVELMAEISKGVAINGIGFRVEFELKNSEA